MHQLSLGREETEWTSSSESRDTRMRIVCVRVCSCVFVCDRLSCVPAYVMCEYDRERLKTLGSNPTSYGCISRKGRIPGCHSFLWSCHVACQATITPLLPLFHAAKNALAQPSKSAPRCKPNLSYNVQVRKAGIPGKSERQVGTGDLLSRPRAPHGRSVGTYD